MDNLEINPSEFYYALRDVKLSIDELEDVKELLRSISNLDYDVSSYEIRINSVDKRLNDLYAKLKKLAKEITKMDPSINNLFNYLNVDQNKEFIFNDDIDKKEKKLDQVKGNNNDLGAKKSKHSSSILSEKEKSLDTLKGGRKGLGGHVTNNASSLLLGGRKK